MIIKLNKKYQDLFKDLQNVRYIILSGGRGSGKSFATSLYLGNKFLHSKFNCIYLRQYLTNANTSTIPMFLNQIKLLNISQYFKVKQGEIQNQYQSKLYFKGFRTASNDSDSQLKSIPRLETVLIEEATEVAEKDFEKLNLSVRDKDASPKIIFCLNPSHKKHWIWKRFFERKDVPYNYCGIIDDTLYIHSTYLDNIENLDESFLKEAEETAYWLELLNESGYIDNDMFKSLYSNCEELIRILVKILKNVQK